MKTTLEECYAEFVKAVAALTIDPAERQKNEMGVERQSRDAVKAENEELKEKLNGMDDLKMEVAMLKRVVRKHGQQKV